MLNPLQWFTGKQIDTFSRELARELASRYPADVAARTPDKKSEKKLGRTLNHIYRQAAEFGRDRGLGIYGTARLGNGFKWELKELGYRHEFVEETTKALLLTLRGK
jgi:hypothetical protein